MPGKKNEHKWGCPGALCLPLLIFMIMFLAFHLPASASWTEGADGSIYSEGETLETEEEEVGKAGSFERKISGLFRSLASGLNGLMSKEGCDLDRIILGRVRSGGQDGSLFTFELRSGNGYGVVATLAYKVLRGIIFVVIAGIMLAKLVKGLFTSGNARAREEMKGALYVTAIGFSLLVLMPFLYDAFLYFRDVILYSVASEGTGGLGLVESFRAAAEESELFIDAMMYLAAVCSSVWFAFEYIGIAMANVVMFICFAFVVVLMFFDRGKLMNWCWNVASLAITPIIDICMLMIPVFIGQLTKGQHPIIQLLVVWSVIPARKLFKNALGLTSTGEAILSGLSAIAMMHGAASLARGGAGAARNAGEKLKGSMQDKKKQRYHEDMAGAQQGDLPGHSDTDKDGYLNEKNMGRDGKNHFFGLFHKNSGKSVGQEGVRNKEMDAEDAGLLSGNAIDAPGGIFGMGKEAETADGSHPYMPMDGREIECLENENNEHRENIAALRQHIAGLEAENVQMETGGTAGSLSAADREHAERNRVQIAKCHEAITKEESAIAKNNSRIGKIQSVTAPKTAPVGQDALNEAELDIMRKHATVDNFEQPEFSGLDHATKAQLYAKRARKRLFQAIGSGAGGTAGLMGGALLGLSATGFYSRSAAAMATGALAHGGASLGGNLGSMAAGSLYHAVSSFSGNPMHRGSVQTHQDKAVNMPTTEYPRPGTPANVRVAPPGIVPAGQGQPAVSGSEIKAVYTNNPSGSVTVKKTIREQVQEVACSPAARSVVQEFCREITTPGSSAMRQYEQEAEKAARDGSRAGHSFQANVQAEMASRISGDIMRQISENGTPIASAEVYGALRGDIEKNVHKVLIKWREMSGFDSQIEE